MRQIGKSQQARLETVEALLAGKKVALAIKTDIDREISAYKNLGFDVEYKECFNNRGIDLAWFVRNDYIYTRQQEVKPPRYILKLKNDRRGRRVWKCK